VDKNKTGKQQTEERKLCFPQFAGGSNTHLFIFSIMYTFILHRHAGKYQKEKRNEN